MMFDLWIEKKFYDGTILCLTGSAPPMAFADREGGEWLSIGPKPKVKEPVASVLFEDGTVYDIAQKSWRKIDSKPRIRAKAG